ncbi:MAG: chromosome segregation protein SMC [Lachnospiraceae bacterium]|nr:chromosome segregation protein SMC [Lachnospiraceae bacterium]
MYLKSIEIHGFKSFANKILFEFHDGITAIVGPNGSGKSNVADAVRWVLGEQSAKQLRGSSMQDVIFSGSEARKPMGYAYVEITFDNSDHKLGIDYEEVAVARRVYRSGESEYLLNNNVCRLKDVQELFMDTGIGKEGYSIIGQGQIDKILSTKPEDRRELFDEAAGIVKFKKRKSVAEKNLFEATDNLIRVNDIIGELEKQIGPLEKQSEVAREYLRLKEILKNLEVNNFLKEYEESGKKKKDLDEKCDIAVEELENTKNSNEKAEAEYKRLDGVIAELEESLNGLKNDRQETLIDIEKKEGEIKLLNQQLENIVQNKSRISESLKELDSEIDEKFEERARFEKQKQSFEEKINDCSGRRDEAGAKLEAIRSEIEKLSGSIEDANGEILEIANLNGQVRTNIEHADTIIEQLNIRRAELSSRLLTLKSDEADGIEIAGGCREKLENINSEIKENEDKRSGLEKKIVELNGERKKYTEEIDRIGQEYMGLKSRLEALVQISERYDGYSTPVKKVMENKDSFPGICGVVADLFSTEKKYETAVETALGASIQHVVTEDEKTAKNVIEYLKREKLGRATFLPITSIGDGNRGKVENDVFDEKGVIGDAASLVSADEKYAGIVRHLLKSFVVVDNVDNALLIAKKYDYNIRLVTLEGELLSPGGSIAGGAYKTKGNLLGRKREIEELEVRIGKKSKELDSLRKELAGINENGREASDNLEKVKNGLRDMYVSRNTADMELKASNKNLEDIRSNISGYKTETQELEKKISELKKEIENENRSLSDNDEKSRTLSKSIEDTNALILEKKAEEKEAADLVSKIALDFANIEQASNYTGENIARIDSEIERLKANKERIRTSSEEADEELESKKEHAGEIKELIEAGRVKVEALAKNIEELTGKKEQINHDHKEFFNSWSELSKQINDLEKEAMRLQNQRDKLGEILDAQVTYMWEEYQLTPTTAEEYRDEEFKASSARKDISDCRQSIKKLGDVNVNAIEEFKNVSERYGLLTGQRKDLTESKAKIEELIKELDEAMRKQFTERFEFIRQEFNVVFRELFGGGKGELELIEDEDVLEAGIRIIAQPPGKKLQNMMQLSGGEKALTAISLLFAIQNLKPSPFCLLDEIEAALDDSNVKRYASYLHKLTKNSQFIVITHRRGTMASADMLYGITMQEKGVSTLVSVSLIEDDLDK